MRINEVEKLVGIPKKNIRFYEEQGLLHPGRESENGYRSYGPAEVETLRCPSRKFGICSPAGLPSRTAWSATAFC